MISAEALQLYWSGDLLAANAFIGLNLIGALLLGMAVGYERTFNGRAAGMRTYALVCMASTALTIFVGFAPLWYGGTAHDVSPDATRVVGGVVTGIGFLCAGVIVKDGLSISGLTTAASIWAVAAVGVLLGVGLYGSALLLAGLCMLSMTLVHQIERWSGPRQLPRDLDVPARLGPALRGTCPSCRSERLPGDAWQLQLQLRRQPPGMALLRGGAAPGLAPLRRRNSRTSWRSRRTSPASASSRCATD